MDKRELAQKYFEERRRKSALRWLELYHALKHRGVSGFKKKIVEFTATNIETQ